MPFLNHEDLDLLLALADSVENEQMLSILQKSKAAIADPGLREQAHDEYGSDDIEIDDVAATSPADDGVWVAAWVWIKQEDEDEQADS